MSKKRDFQINVVVSEQMLNNIKRLVETGEFDTTAEYIRFLVRVDLEKRLSALEGHESRPEN